MALDAAKALQALHEASIAPIVHFDIKPQQLLLGEDGRLMLNDFNMAQFMGIRGSGVSCPLRMKRGCRAVAWRAPENIAGKVIYMCCNDAKVDDDGLRDACKTVESL